MKKNVILQSVKNGVLGALALLAVYFGVVSFISGFPFAWYQFSSFWYFIVTLAAGFGIQVGLYTFLEKTVQHQTDSGKMVAVSGTTSTAAMISCCSHYLVNVLPFLGVAGALGLIAQYQIELFWLGILVNLVGIIWVGRRAVRVYQHAKMMG